MCYYSSSAACSFIVYVFGNWFPLFYDYVVFLLVATDLKVVDTYKFIIIKLKQSHYAVI